MIPEQRPSTTPVPGSWLNPPAERAVFSYHWGPVALNDPSQGLLVQLWTAEITGVGKDTVTVSAPGIPAVTLFTRPMEVKEISLAFDQNGQPYIAFVQDDGTAWLWWYDSVSEAMVFTQLDAGVITPRITLDDARTAQNGVNDVVLLYVRAGNLYYRQQRDRFLTEYFLQSDTSELYHVSMNSALRLQWTYAGPGMPLPPFLAEVVQGICLEAGIPPENIDVSELWNDRVMGLPIDTEEGLDEPLESLREIFQFDKSQHDKKLYFPKRGRAPVAWIPYAHLKPKSPASLEMIFEDEQELPTQVHVEHIDSEGGFAKNKQTAMRRSNMVFTKEEERIKTQVVLTPDQAATAAAQILKKRWNEQIEYKFTTTIRYAALTPGDVVMVEDAKGTWHRIRLEQKDEDTGNIDWEGRADAGSRAYAHTATGNALPPPTSTTPGVVTETQLEIIDCSPLFDQHDELGLYVAAAGLPGGTWAGYDLFVSVDGGLSYQEALTSSAPSCIGETVTNLADETSSGHDFVSSETFEVTTNFPLTSVTSGQIASGSNRFCIGGEIGQFETATLIGMVGTLYHYELSDLRRAEYGTSAPLWPSGTRFVLLDETVQFVQAQRAMIGLDIEHKPVSYGHSLDDTTPLLYLFDDPESQKEWTPDDVQATRDAMTDDVTVTFTPRPRLGQFGTPFNSKYFRGHRVKFSDDHVIDTYADTAVYPAAPPGVTVQVCGLNEITGEGPYSAAVTPV